MKNQEIIKRIARNAIVLALYCALTFASYPVAFANIQFRISELLVLLCFFNRDYIVGLTLGCFLCNLASPFMPWDLLIGTGATFISCLLMSFCRHLGIAALLPIASNSFLVAIEYKIYLEQPYWISVGLIAIGESVVIIVGYILFMIFFKRKDVQSVIDVKRNSDFKW